MTGKVIIVTGANSGIGYEASRLLCEGGNDVILACRNEEKGKAAVEKILKENPNALATFMQLDMADLASVRKFVEDFHATEKKLHVLINNAGVYLAGTQRQFTTDNFELTMGTNHLGPFLLTNLLLEDLKKSGADGGEARVVFVTSTLHDIHSKGHRKGVEALDIENFFLEKAGSYSAHQAYKNSKVANVMTTYELAKQLEGSGVTVNAVCPGFVPNTGLTRHANMPSRFFTRWVLGGVLRFMKITRTLEQGTKAVVELACGEKLKGVTGKYYIDGEEHKSSEESLDEELRKKLIELSGGYCHMDGFEPLDAPPPPPPPAETPKKSKSKKEKKDAAGEQSQAPVEEQSAEKTEDADKKADDQDEKKDEEKKDDEGETKEEKTEGSDEKTTDDTALSDQKTDELKKESGPEVTPAPEITAQ